MTRQNSGRCTKVALREIERIKEPLYFSKICRNIVNFLSEPVNEILSELHSTPGYSRIGEGALGDGDLVDLVLAGGQTWHPGVVVLLLLDVVVLPQLPEHLVHAEEGGALAEWSVLQDRGQVHHPPVIVGSAATPVQHLVIGSLEQTVPDIISEYQTKGMIV